MWALPTAVYFTMIRPLLEYASPVWAGAPSEYFVNEYSEFRREVAPHVS